MKAPEVTKSFGISIFSKLFLAITRERAIYHNAIGTKVTSVTQAI